LFITLFVIITHYGKAATAIDRKLRESMNNIAPSHAIKFARWQHPAVGRGAIFAVPAPCFIEVTFPINTLKQKSTIYDEQLPTHLENVDSQKI